METSTAVKALSGGAVGAGVLGASGYGIHVLTTKSDEPKIVPKPRTIEEKLKLDGEDILPTDGDSEDDVWKKLLEKYKAETNGQSEVSVLDDIEMMKTYCSTLLSTSLEDAYIDTTINQAKSWCVKEKG